MNKGLLALSVAVLFGVSGCNFFGGKKEEDKAQETKQVAENDMTAQAAANEAEKNALMAMAGEGQAEQPAAEAGADMDAGAVEQPAADMEADMGAGAESAMDGHAGHDHDMGAGEPSAQPQP